MKVYSWAEQKQQKNPLFEALVWSFFSGQTFSGIKSLNKSPFQSVNSRLCIEILLITRENSYLSLVLRLWPHQSPQMFAGGGEVRMQVAELAQSSRGTDGRRGLKMIMNHAYCAYVSTQLEFTDWNEADFVPF